MQLIMTIAILLLLLMVPLADNRKERWVGKKQTNNTKSIQFPWVSRSNVYFQSDSQDGSYNPSFCLGKEARLLKWEIKDKKTTIQLCPMWKHQNYSGFMFQQALSCSSYREKTRKPIKAAFNLFVSMSSSVPCIQKVNKQGMNLSPIPSGPQFESPWCMESTHLLLFVVFIY